MKSYLMVMGLIFSAALFLFILWILWMLFLNTLANVVFIKRSKKLLEYLDEDSLRRLKIRVDDELYERFERNK